MARTSRDKPQLITFYSYKGGVGRTMAVANAACQLAIKHGHHVICIDWDLEAPGLHHYFGYQDEELAGKAGLLDYLRDFIWQVEHKRAEGKPPRLETYLQPLKPEDKEKIKFGSVQFMHCGRTDERYMEHVQEFDWNRFYEKQHGYEIIETFKQQLREAVDITLIDARAGQADVGTTPTVQMPDAVALLFTSNRQNLFGTEEIARRLATHPLRTTQDLEPPKILLVPARVFPQDESFKRWMKKSAIPVYEKLVGEEVLSRRDQPKGLWQCFLPIDGRYAVEEQLAVLESDPVLSPLKEAYISLAQALDNVHQGLAAWTAESVTIGSGAREGPTVDRPDAPGSAGDESLDRLEELRGELREARDRGDSERLALVQFQIGVAATKSRRYEEAHSMLDASLTYNTDAENQTAVRAIMSWQGSLAAHQSQFDEAWSLYKRSLALDEEAGDARGQSVTLHAMGNVRVEQKRFDDAWPLYERSLALDQEADDVTGQGRTLHAMGNLRGEQKRSDDAWPLYKRSLALEEEAGDARAQAVTLHAMGNVRVEQKRFDDAWPLYERSLALDEEAGDARGQGVTLNEMGSVRVKQKRFDDAWSLYERALVLKEEAGDARGLGITLHAMGIIRREQGRFDDAETLLRRGLAIAEKEGDPEGVDHFHEALSEVERDRQVQSTD